MEKRGAVWRVSVKETYRNVHRKAMKSTVASKQVQSEQDDIPPTCSRDKQTTSSALFSRKKFAKSRRFLDHCFLDFLDFYSPHCLLLFLNAKMSINRI